MRFEKQIRNTLAFGSKMTVVVAFFEGALRFSLRVMLRVQKEENNVPVVGGQATECIDRCGRLLRGSRRRDRLPLMQLLLR